MSQQAEIYDIALIGAGASALMFASQLNNLGIRIICLDANKRAGVKIKISGGGRCNVTNKYFDSSKYIGDKDFIEPIISRFSNKDILRFLNHNGLTPKLSQKLVKGAYFCNSSQDIINLFAKLTSNIEFMFNTLVSDASYDSAREYFCINAKNSNQALEIKAKNLVIASGSLSFPALNATNIGANIASSFNHTIIKQKPALVGFCVQPDEFWFKNLSGISMYVHIKVANQVFKGGFLFTHKGCSGPVVLNASAYWDKGVISIDFDPNKENKIPKRVKQAIKNHPTNNDIHNYTFAPAGTFGYTKAEVTKGGVSTDEVDAKTLQSKKQKGLYFIGEVLDVVGQLGGYNISWAFASGYVCAKHFFKKQSNEC